MKKILTVLCVLSLSTAFVAYGRTPKTTLGMLRSKIWKMRFDHPSGYEKALMLMKFTADSMISYDVWFKSGKDYGRTKAYYLSDTTDSVFRSELIGKATRGRYIITYNDKLNRTNATEIQQLSDTLLTMQYVIPAGEIRLGGGPVSFVPYVPDKRRFDKKL